MDGPSVGKRRINLGPVIAQGAAGTIHHVVGESGILGKLYKNPKDLPNYRDKIEAMLAARPNLPPFPFNGKTYVQMAWPLGTIANGHGDFLGFVMPEVDLQASTVLENILQKATRKWKRIPEFYGARVLLAANLAALMVELHGLDHHMVDMKPINMRFYPDAWYLAILDTDGFSINGQRRFPAQQFSDEYIAPEALGKSPETLGLDQDLFALATIIFRLINNGLHPFQGVDLRPNHPTTLQERIFGGLYSYGMSPHPDVRPAPSSIHDFLEYETRQLFDRAFLSRAGRPTAIEWRNHLGSLLNNKTLVQCKTSKDHAHFSKGCGLCAVEKSSRQPPPPPQGTGTTQWSSHVITNFQVGPGTNRSALIVVWLKDNLKIVARTIGALVLMVWLFPLLERSPSPTPTPAPTPTPTPGGDIKPHPPPSPPPLIPAAEFSIVNNTSSTVNVAFFDGSDRTRVDPPQGRVYILNGDSTQTYRTNCAPGQSICYGASMQGPPLSPYWGLGRDGKETCSECCIICPTTNAVVKTLNTSDTRRPNPSITWTFLNNTSGQLSVAFYSQTRPQIGWPGWDQNWSMNSRENTYSLSCLEEEKICYGAWFTSTPSALYWGVGPFAKYGCSNCCHTCDGGAYTTSLDQIEPVPDAPRSEPPQQWLHNGSSFFLVTTGNQKKFIFNVVRSGLLEVGVQPGTVIFEGVQSAQSVKGTAYVFSKMCGAVSYNVEGYVMADERRIVLNGWAPYVDSNCTRVSYHVSTMEFKRAD